MTNSKIRIETSDVTYVLTAKLDKGALTGNWSTENEKGTWTGRKVTASSK